MKQVKLSLDKDEYILIDLESDKDEVFSCDVALIYYVVSGKKLLLWKDFVDEGVSILISLLENALNETLFLHDSINKDIGYVWNQILSKKIKQINDKDGFWVGESNLLWSTPGSADNRLTTWLFNKKDGSILLEITPSYKWHFMEPEDSDDFITYEEFINNYKPLVVKKIPNKTVEKWIIKASEVLALINNK